MYQVIEAVGMVDPMHLVGGVDPSDDRYGAMLPEWTWSFTSDSGYPLNGRAVENQLIMFRRDVR